MQAALCGYVAEGSEEEGEAQGFFMGKVSEDPGDVIEEGKSGEDEDTSPHDDEVAVRVLSREGLDRQCDEAKDNDDGVDPVEGVFGDNQERSNEKTQEWNREGSGDFASVAAEKSCSREIKEGRNRHQVIAGGLQTSEEDGR